jgi:hypothetical protein
MIDDGTLLVGEKVKSYWCCGDGPGSMGCSRGPHVWKEEIVSNLHKQTPFVELPEHIDLPTRQDIVALDCEMVKKAIIAGDADVLTLFKVLHYPWIRDGQTHGRPHQRHSDLGRIGQTQRPCSRPKYPLQVAHIKHFGDRRFINIDVAVSQVWRMQSIPWRVYETSSLSLWISKVFWWDTDW